MDNTKEIIAELRRKGFSNGGSLGHHSGLMDEAADLIEKLQKENEFHQKTIQENSQKALRITLEEIEKAEKEAKIEATEEIFKRIELILSSNIYYKIESQLNEVREEYIKEIKHESK